MDIDLVKANLAQAKLGKIKQETADIKKDPAKEKELKEACAGFEAIFLKTMITAMRDSLPGNGLFKESNGMNIYTSMYDQSLADALSKSQTSIGLKEFLYRQIK